MAMSVPSVGVVAVAVPTLAYWPAWAVPVAMQTMVSPGASNVAGHETATPWSSVTEMPVRVPRPTLATV